MTDDEPMIVRSVTVAETMASDGALHIEISEEGDPSPWDVIGLLQVALDRTRAEMAAVWAEVDEAAGDD